MSSLQRAKHKICDILFLKKSDSLSAFILSTQVSILNLLPPITTRETLLSVRPTVWLPELCNGTVIRRK